MANLEILTYALWLGILTSISPCPLAANIAAISFIGRKAGIRGAVVFAGFLYALGRAFAYLAVALVVIAGLTSISTLSQFLQKNMHVLLGPLLILTGMIILELITLPTGRGFESERVKKLVEKSGMWSAFLVGIIFALAFCPTSAAIYFGTLVPMAFERQSPVFVPLLYGIGTALPVIIVAVVLAKSAEAAGKVIGAMSKIEKWARLVTGVLLILIGIYMSLHYIFGVI